MKNNYSVLLATAALLVSGGTQAQRAIMSDNARQATIQAKLNGPGAHYSHTGERGANDECAGAVPLTVGTSCTATNGDLANATESQAPATCNGYTAAEANDLWFSVTATSIGTRFEATGGPEIDPIIEVFSGDCGALVSEGCSDGTLVEETEGVTLGTTIGTTYLVRVYYWIYDPLPTDFSFTVCAYETDPPPPAPENDLCSSVTPAALIVGTPLTFTGTTIGATANNDYASGSLLDGQGPSVWHAFTTEECATVQVEYCGTTPFFTNVWIVLTDACPANDLIFFQSWDTTSCGDQNITIIYDSLEAGTYYLPVLVDPVAANGPYTIDVTATATPGLCTVGLDEVGQQGLEWSVFPNPGAGVFNLRYSGKNGVANIEVMDVTGRVVYNEQAQLAKGTTTSLDLTGVSTGNYSVRLTVDGVRTEQRLMVK